MIAAAPLTEGDEIGPFTVLREIGRGSWAVVYDAVHRVSGEIVALKFMLDAAATPSLKREFRIARGLAHPHLVRLYEMHQAERGAFFTMERVLGGDLVTRCLRVPDAAARAALVRRLFGDLADALWYLHAAAVVHRDIKPANVLVDASDHVVVVDFGLAESVGAPAGRGFSGTLAYASPERLRGQRATPSSDWYAFGVLLFEALVGTLPYARTTNAALMARIEGKRFDVASKVPVAARELTPLIEHLLAPSPSERAAAHDVLAALGRSAKGTRRGPLVGRGEGRAWLESRLAGGGVSAVVGASGMGKTSLVASVVDGLGPEFVVLRSQCHPRENVPFNAFDGAVGTLLERARAATSKDDADVELLERVFERPSAASRPERGEGVTPARVAEAFSRLVEIVAERGAETRRTVVVLVDDVQWADRDSVALLELLADGPFARRVTWLVIARGALDDVPAPLRRVIAADGVLALGPLRADESVALLRGLAPTLGAERAEELARLGGNQPLSLVELARYADGEAPPKDIASLLLGVAETRTGGQREILATLAMHDGPIDSDVLVAVESAALARAYDLLDIGLVEFERNAARYAVRLRHGEIAAALRDSLLQAERDTAHLALARAYGRARPDDADARFRHLVAGNRPVDAAAIGLDAARQLRDRVALHRAIERYKWMREHGGHGVTRDVVLRELAETQGRAGEALDAADTYLALAARSPVEASAARRAAGEQLLRAGDVERGRALLERCMQEAGMRAPRSRVVQAAWILAGRARIRAHSLDQPLDRAPSEATRQKLDVAWSTGLGLNLVDVVASMLAQVQFTDLALRAGSAEQIARAVGVEYSYAMITGGAWSSSRSRALEAAMERLGRAPLDPYAIAMMDLSRAAGDFFRGAITDVAARASRARALFESTLGQKSWELANCAMYESWAHIELDELERVAVDVPAYVRLARARGDTLYRQCFVGGPAAAAWLVEGRVDELVTHLDAVAAQARNPTGGMSQAAFFDAIARTRVDLYRGQGEAAWTRLSALWPRIERSGFLALRWMRLTLAVALVQAALAVPRDRVAARVVSQWIPRIGAIRHPAARGWALALDAASRREGARSAPAFEAAARAFDAVGFRLAARLAREASARSGGEAPTDVPAVVSAPDAFFRAMFAPLPGG